MAYYSKKVTSRLTRGWKKNRARKKNKRFTKRKQITLNKSRTAYGKRYRKKKHAGNNFISESMSWLNRTRVRKPVTATSGQRRTKWGAVTLKKVQTISGKMKGAKPTGKGHAQSGGYWSKLWAQELDSRARRNQVLGYVRNHVGGAVGGAKIIPPAPPPLPPMPRSFGGVKRGRNGGGGYVGIPMSSHAIKRGRATHKRSSYSSNGHSAKRSR